MIIINPYRFGSASTATISHEDFATDATNLTAYTFSAQPYGGAGLIAVVVHGKATGGTNQTCTVTIGGNSMTSVVEKVHSETNGDYYLGIFTYRMTSGTSADVVATFSRQQVRAGSAVYRMQSVADDTADWSNSTNGSSASSLALNSTSGLDSSVGIFAAHWNSVTTTWTNATEDYDTSVETFSAFTGASSNDLPTSETITATPSSSSNGVMVGATWS